MTDKKAIFIRVIMISSLVIVAAVAIFIQLIVQVEFSDAIEFNDPAVAMIDVPSPRGNIYDVNGNFIGNFNACLYHCY